MTIYQACTAFYMFHTVEQLRAEAAARMAGRVKQPEAAMALTAMADLCEEEGVNTWAETKC